MASIETFIGSEGSIRWELNRRMRMLTLMGEGELPDFNPYEDHLPSWSYLRDYIQEVRIGEGLTRIGNYTFFPYDYQELSKLQSRLRRVVFPFSLQSIGYSAFRGNVRLERINLSRKRNLRCIEPYAFASCFRAKALDLAGCIALETIQSHAFSDCEDLSYVDLSSCRELNPKDIARLRGDLADYIPIIGPEGSFYSLPDGIHLREVPIS